jgi:hypothetical protein
MSPEADIALPDLKLRNVPGGDVAEKLDVAEK